MACRGSYNLCAKLLKNSRITYFVRLLTLAAERRRDKLRGTFALLTGFLLDFTPDALGFVQMNAQSVLLVLIGTFRTIAGIPFLWLLTCEVEGCTWRRK